MPKFPIENAVYLANTDFCPLISQDFAGIQGTVYQTPEHFYVHETPLYLPTGEGQHYMALMYKRDYSTYEALWKVAKASGVDIDDIGYAGRKDRYAVTTQWITLTKPPVQPNIEEIKILGWGKHRNKLKLGHLVGNRFEIKISHPHLNREAPDQIERFEAHLQCLQKGIPNYFGGQRFGREVENIKNAFQLIENPRKRVRDPQMLISALQSAMFNDWLGRRIKDGLWDRVILGDICKKVASGGPFYVTDVEAENERLARGEIEILGPMIGPKMFQARDEALLREQALMADWGIFEGEMKVIAKFWEGDRRPAKILIKDLGYEWEGEDLWLKFALPKGSFATVVLTELMKSEGGFFRKRENLEVTVDKRGDEVESDFV
jgi:tRNA pseudouridine13 synthase